MARASRGEVVCDAIPAGSYAVGKNYFHVRCSIAAANKSIMVQTRWLIESDEDEAK
jgi:hypothetical protein